MKKLFQKSLLVAAGLLVGASAWAEDTYETVYTRAAVSDWTDADKTDWNASSAVEVNATNGLGANANLTATYVSKSFTVADNCKIKYEVDWVFGTATGRTNNWNWIQFGDFLRIAVNSSYNVQVSTDAGTTWNATTLEYLYNQTATKHIVVVFDTQLKTIESFTFGDTDRTSLVAGTYNNATFNTLSTGFIRGGSVSWGLANYLKTVTVSQAEKAAVPAATYTINYTYEGTTVKSETGESVEGAQITAESVITVDGVKYLCTAAAAPSLTLAAGENTLEVPVRLPYTATLNVTTNIAGNETVVTTNLVETDNKDCSWSYVYPYYVESEGVYYVADETASFGETGTFTDGEVINKTVKYSTAVNSIVYYGEPNQGTPGTNVAFSNGNTGYITGGVAYNKDDVIRLGTLPAGNYMLIVNVTGDANRNVVLGDCSDTSVFPTAIVTFTGTGVQSKMFKLTEDTPISISGKDQGNGKFNQSSTLDYIIVKKIESLTIVGDFAGKDLEDSEKWSPANGFEMTQDTENPAVWTAVVSPYTISGSTNEELTYYYKAMANDNWIDYVLPSGANQNYNFNYDGAGAGTYTLTFTANTDNNTVELSILKLDDNTYTVAGNNEEMFGTAWDPTNTNNDMTRNSDNTFTWKKEGVELEAGTTIMYKVTKNHGWDESWPNLNQEIEIKDAGKYDITITFNATNQTVTEAIAIQKTISSAGYATYCSPYDLNFEGTGVTAYVAAVNGSEVSFEEVTEAKANTGLLLKAAEGTYSLPMLEASDAAKSSALVGVLVDTEVAAGSFVLLNGANGVGFYKTSKPFTVGANTAYLPAAAGEARTFIGFNGESTTAIEGVAAAQENVVVYNLKGQRVAQPTKGLYIVNGKKVVLK